MSEAQTRKSERKSLFQHIEVVPADFGDSVMVCSGVWDHLLKLLNIYGTCDSA